MTTLFYLVLVALSGQVGFGFGWLVLAIVADIIAYAWLDAIAHEKYDAGYWRATNTHRNEERRERPNESFDSW